MSTTKSAKTPAHQSRTETPGQQIRIDKQGFHFNPNNVQHYYSMTGITSHMGC